MTADEITTAQAQDPAQADVVENRGYAVVPVAVDAPAWRPEGMAEPSAAAQARGVKAQAELHALGMEVWVETKWWGFQVHMNPEAAEKVVEIEELIADVVEAVIPRVGDLIALCMKLHAAGIKVANALGSHGVKCSSPWFAPSWLIPTPRSGPRQDQSLWWTVFEPSTEWNEDEKFTAHESGGNPALAVFNGKLVCVHRGFADNFLWYTVYDPETGWSPDVRMNGQRSSHGPALAVLNGTLYCVYKAHNNTILWSTSFNGSRWTDGVQLPWHQSSHGPGLAAHDGRLHLVHRAQNNHRMWHSTWDPAGGWSNDSQMPAHETGSNPALISWDGNLHLVHRGGNSVSLYHSVWEKGKGWGHDYQMHNTLSLEGPALAIYNNEMYVIHRGSGNNDQHLWWTRRNRAGAWTSDKRFPGHLSGEGPAAAVYRDPNGSRDQLVVVHRGWGARAAGSDSAEVEARLAAEQAANAEQSDTP